MASQAAADGLKRQHGVVDEARQRKPSYEVWKDLNAPAHIDMQWVNAAGAAITGFTATVTPNAEQNLPYYPLHDYLMTWSLLDEKGRVVSRGMRRYDNLIRTEHVVESLPLATEGHSMRLIVRLLGPTGSIAAERILDGPAIQRTGGE